MYVRNLKHAQLEDSVIKLMSFDTLAISIKLRVKSKDAFIKKKITLISFVFKKINFQIFFVIFNFEERGEKIHTRKFKMQDKKKVAYAYLFSISCMICTTRWIPAFI